MLFGLPEMKVFAETSSDPRIKALWSRLEETRKKNALWCDEVNTLRDQLRWRKWPDEKPTENEANFLIVDKYNICSVKYWYEDDAWLWHELLENGSCWRPIGPLPGKGAE
jgi:hypothetical protein